MLWSRAYSLGVPSTAEIRVVEPLRPGADQHVAGVEGVAGLDAVDPGRLPEQRVPAGDRPRVVAAAERGALGVFTIRAKSLFRIRIEASVTRSWALE